MFAYFVVPPHPWLENTAHFANILLLKLKTVTVQWWDLDGSVVLSFLKCFRKWVQCLCPVCNTTAHPGHVPSIKYSYPLSKLNLKSGNTLMS